MSRKRSLIERLSIRGRHFFRDTVLLSVEALARLQLKIVEVRFGKHDVDVLVLYDLIYALEKREKQIEARALRRRALQTLKRQLNEGPELCVCPQLQVAS